MPKADTRRGRAAMTMPNAHRAFVDIDKLTAYCLNPAHPRGRHKARVFESALGITAANAGRLRDALLQAARSEEARAADGDEHGQR